MERMTASGRREFLSAEDFAELLLKAGDLAANDHPAHKLRRYGRLMHREKILLATEPLGLHMTGQAAFDRGEYRFHGRVKALARAATEAGLVCTGLTDTAPKVAKEAAPAAAPKKEKKAGKGEKQPA